MTSPEMDEIRKLAFYNVASYIDEHTILPSDRERLVLDLLTKRSTLEVKLT